MFIFGKSDLFEQFAYAAKFRIPKKIDARHYKIDKNRLLFHHLQIFFALCIALISRNWFNIFH